MGRRGNVSHATAFMVRHRAVDRGIDSDLDKWSAGRRLESRRKQLRIAATPPPEKMPVAPVC